MFSKLSTEVTYTERYKNLKYTIQYIFIKFCTNRTSNWTLDMYLAVLCQFDEH